MSDDRGRFGGDMDRNEVEIDLNQFMLGNWKMRV